MFLGSVLRIAAFIGDTQAEGPGRRAAIWVQGCSLHCPGCCNPKMLAFDSGAPMFVTPNLVKTIASSGVEGITVLGGEPIAQPDAVANLCELAHFYELSVMLFTGYTMEELYQMIHHQYKLFSIQRIINNCDIIVDGPYDRSKPETKRRWIGSSNQVIHFLTDRYDPSDPMFLADNTIEIRLENGVMTVNGWPQAADDVLRRGNGLGKAT